VLEQSHGNTNNASEHDFSTTSKQGFGKLIRSRAGLGDFDYRIRASMFGIKNFGGP
jgi:hypothetical protein